VSTLNGTTFNDINFNGIFDAGDVALPGVTVFLDSNGNGLPDSAEKIAATDVNGIYSFPNLAAGSYLVGSTVAPGLTRTSPVSAVTLTGAADIATFNIANTAVVINNPIVPSLTGNINGAVFVDNNLLGLYNYAYDDKGNVIANPNGFSPQTQVYDPLVDATLPRVPVYIDLNNDGFLNANEPRTLSNEAGFYNFNALPAGSYLLRIAQTADKVDGALSILGDLQTTNTPLVVDVFAGSTINKADLGVVVPNSVYGKVINDLNGNGVPEANEPGINGITVFLDSNGNNVFDLGEKSTVSGIDGAYIIKGLNTNVGQESNETLAQNPYLAYQLLNDPLSVAKTFPVTSLPPTTAYVRTSPSPGATINAPVIPGGSAQANFLYTFAQTPTAVLRDSITGFVFNDLNSDGIVQPGEPNKAGVQVYLDFNNNGKRDNDTSLVEPASVTDASGSFGFFNLTTPGDYIVRTTGNFPTTAIPNVILGSGQAAQLAIGVSGVQPKPAINPNALVPVPGVQVVAQNAFFPNTGFPVV
jgi:hypothetical protein